ncbi:GT-D fold domain-containing glycosyltransferase [Lactiplantibacillus pingfangensis]|uniref:GT-D fold domain-containing glycosyltransferase n=1 Tax=Lactiplantibacillus pingfangensis TaxID=2559915 RepID=UPI001484C946|nr:GT-D fold domain-containing glycosyltransferase [Lactiplantibacillus pingfangensis]
MTHRNLLKVLGNRLTVFYYNLKYLRLRSKFENYHVMSIPETLKLITEKHLSISRFGDGEFKWIEMRKQDSFQRPDRKLSERLSKVLESDNENCLIGLPDAFSGTAQFTNDGKRGWRLIMAKDVLPMLPRLDLNRVYGNANISRPYMDFKDKEAAHDTFNQFKQLWHQRQVLIVEGAKSRLGVGNDLFHSAASVHRILCPERDAWERYQEIYDATIRIANRLEDPIVIVALGPTATVLAFDLSHAGIQALDLGHVDVEYEWMKAGYQKKHAIPGKYVNEAPTEGGREVNATINNQKYNNQIVMKVGIE